MTSSPNDTTRIIDPDDSPENESKIPLLDWEVYKIESLLGEGGMGRVYKAFDPKLNRYVALKFIRSDDEKLKKRLIREARAQAQIDHDHVCKIYEVGEVDGKPYIAMQFIEGYTLQELVKEMSLEQKVLLMQQVSDALQSAHKLGIIHRDIKPSNIMVERRQDGSFRPYIMDFGIAREISDPGITATNMVVGTPAFMAPEQIQGDESKVDRRTDIYKLGVTLYYIFTGRTPFEGSGMDIFVKLASEDPVRLKQISPTIPEDLDIIVTKCIEKDPSQRYDSARALADDLKRYLDGEPILAHRATLRYRFTKKVKKHKVVAIVASLSFILILAMTGFSLSSYWNAAKEVEVARHFSKSIEEMDWVMRVAHMAPLHDIRKERAQVLRRMKEIETMMANARKAGVGPGNFALGRGYLTLQDYEKARVHLEKAWSVGYQRKEVANALGLTLGALYKNKLSEINRIKDQETRKKKLLAVEKEYRDPAVHYLRQTPELGSQSREYGEALLAYYEKKWDTALRLARTSSEKFPWLYDAKILEGDVFSQLGEEFFLKGNFNLAEKQFKAGVDSYARAEDTARSNPALYQSQCSLWRALMILQFVTGKDAKKEYERSNESCRKAMIVNPEDATTYELSARTAWRWGENEYMLGHDAADVMHSAIEMSRKALVFNPDSAYAYFTIGTAYGYLADHGLQTGKDSTENLNQSIQALKLSVQKDPTNPSPYTSLAGSYYSMGNEAFLTGGESKSFFLQAIEAFKKALELNPRHLAAQSNMANAYTYLGIISKNSGNDPTQYFKQSIESSEKALKLNPNYWLVRTNLAAVYLEQIDYELNHGKNPSATIEKVLNECQKAEDLKAGNPHSAINSATAYLYYGEYALAQNENPLQWTKKAEDRLTSLTGIDFPEASIGLADAKRIEAQYLLQKKKSPLLALNQSMNYFGDAFKINPEEFHIRQGKARLELIKAEWLILKNNSPEEPLTIAAAELYKALKLNPKLPQAFAILGKVALKKSEWKNQLKENPEVEIQKGLSAIEKSIQINRDFAEAYITKANLLLIQAQWSSDSKTHNTILADSIENFNRAFSINPVLKNKEKEKFEIAESLAANLTSP